MASTFYVSPQGNDTNPGSMEEPFATIARARDAIREMKAKQPLSQPVTVMLRGGRYFLDDTLVFNQEDSGSEECPITYTAYPDEIPVISGGRKITGPWKPYQGEIMVCSISEVGEGKWNFRQLFVNGDRQNRARFPRDGYYMAEKALDATSFRYKEGEFRRWHNLSDVEVVVFHSWNESRLLVSDLDEDGRTVRFLDPKAKHPIGWASHTRYYVENVFEALEQPGDWYLDTHTGEIYYWPIGDVEELDMVAPVLNQLIRFEGGLKEQFIQYINIRGLTFSDTDWTLPENGYPDCGDVGDIVDPSAIALENVRYCNFQDNCIRNVGTYGLELTGYGNQIIGNEIYDTGSGGIVSRNYDEEHNVISYNHIHHCGAAYPSAVGINIDDGGGTVSHNLVHDTGHSCIYARHWATDHQPRERENQEQGLIIEYNELYHAMTKVNDGAGIFVRDSNIIIRNNLIHDCVSPEMGHGSPAFGIYLGCETRNSRVENNVVYRTLAGQLIWYKNRDNIVENNIFVDGERAQIYYSNQGDLRHENVRLLRNIIYYTKPDAILFQVNREGSMPAESDYNVIFHAGGKELVNKGIPGIDSFEDWQKRDLDNHSIVADPLFVDPANDDYSLKPDSPALKLGFRPIDMSRVGLRGREK
ncbi:right-handed parallel beta-helix repeat-containing protein [Candidatus Poribacteria bacterium]